MYPLTKGSSTQILQACHFLDYGSYAYIQSPNNSLYTLIQNLLQTIWNMPKKEEKLRLVIWDFLHGVVVHYNSEKNRGKNKGILVIITTKIVGEILQLPIVGIHAPPTMQKDKAHKFLSQVYWSGVLERKGGLASFRFPGEVLIQSTGPHGGIVALWTHAAKPNPKAEQKAPGGSCSSFRHWGFFFASWSEFQWRVSGWNWTRSGWRQRRYPPYPLKIQHKHPSSRGRYLLIYLLIFFYLFKKMKEHFRLSSNFEEMVDELRHRMEEILA